MASLTRTDLSVSLFKILRELTDRLQSRLWASFAHSSELKPNLINGNPGVWLALYLTQKHHPQLVSEHLLSEGFEHWTSQLQMMWPDLSCCYGLAGTGWLLEYLTVDQQWQEDPNQQIEQLFLQQFAKGRWQGEYEFVVGLTGFAPFILRRAAQHSAAVRLADAWLSQLEQLAVHNNSGAICWITPANSAFRIIRHNPLYQEVNLGHAHGITGVLHALCSAAGIPALRSRAIRLLLGGAQYLLQQQLPVAGINAYPNLAGQSDVSRLGWCYGDLPIALLFARLANVMREDEASAATFLREAERVSRLCLKRTAGDGTIQDAGICHGAAGVWLILTLINQQKDGLVPASALQYWQQWIIEHYQARHLSGEGCGRYFAGQHQASDSVLEGDAGLVMVLLSMLGAPLDWVDLFLLS